MYKPVSGLALFFPSVVSGIKKTKGEESVLQLIYTAPHSKANRNRGENHSHAQALAMHRVKDSDQEDKGHRMCVM